MKVRLVAVPVLVFVLVAGASLLMRQAGLADAPANVKATIAYLCKLQTKDGGFAPSASQTKPSLRATLSALRALKYFDGQPTDRGAAIRYVEACFGKESGGFADTPGGKPDVPTTAVGAMALVDLAVPREPYEAGVLRYLGANAKSFEEIRIAAAAVEALGKSPPESKQWLKQIEEMRHADGTFGNARETGGATLALLRLGGKLKDPLAQTLLMPLDRGMRPDGGFSKSDKEPSELESMYRVMRCYRRINVVPRPEQRPEMLRFIERCRNGDGGYGRAPGQPSSASATYYAGFCRGWLFLQHKP